MCAVQNVLGNYADYQNALDKMDVNEQMKCLVGVTDSSHSTSSKTKVKRSGSGPAPVSGNVPVVVSGADIPTPQLTATDSDRKEKSKKIVKEIGREVNRKYVAVPCSRGSSASRATSRDQETASNRIRKKPIIRASAMMPTSDSVKSGADTSVPSKSSKVTGPPSGPSLTRSASGDQLILPDRPTSSSSNRGESAAGIKTKKLKRKKRSPEESHHGLGKTATLSFPHHPPEQHKARPEVLSLPGRGSCMASLPGDGGAVDGTPNDGPDTGDVQHMLDELLHPPALSLVTPIPTPKTSGGPFVFPSLPGGSQVLDQVWWCLTRGIGENKCSGPGVGISVYWTKYGGV